MMDSILSTRSVWHLLCENFLHQQFQISHVVEMNLLTPFLCMQTQARTARHTSVVYFLVIFSKRELTSVSSILALCSLNQLCAFWMYLQSMLASTLCLVLIISSSFRSFLLTLSRPRCLHESFSRLLSINMCTCSAFSFFPDGYPPSLLSVFTPITHFPSPFSLF